MGADLTVTLRAGAGLLIDEQCSALFADVTAPNISRHVDLQDLESLCVRTPDGHPARHQYTREPFRLVGERSPDVPRLTVRAGFLHRAFPPRRPAQGKPGLYLHGLDPEVMQIACASDGDATFISRGQRVLGYRLVFPTEGLAVDEGAIGQDHGVADNIMRLAHRMRSADGYLVTAYLYIGYVVLLHAFPVTEIVFGKHNVGPRIGRGGLGTMGECDGGCRAREGGNDKISPFHVEPLSLAHLYATTVADSQIAFSIV